MSGTKSSIDTSMRGIDSKIRPARRSFFRSIETTGPRNVIIFGETGTGKSSIINMLSDKVVAPVSNHPVGCTFRSTPYPVTIEGVDYTIWDTAGLNEDEAGSVPAGVAISHLHNLVGELSTCGLSLLVYCIRGSRYRDILKVNYDIFHEIICKGEVPIVVIVTGLENEEQMEGWWTENEELFIRRGMVFDGHACVTATKGKKNIFEAEYQKSAGRIRELIRTKCPECAWKVRSKELWLAQITLSIRDYYRRYNSANSAVHMVDESSPEPQNCPTIPWWLYHLLILARHAFHALFDTGVLSGPSRHRHRPSPISPNLPISTLADSSQRTPLRPQDVDPNAKPIKGMITGNDQGSRWRPTKQADREQILEVASSARHATVALSQAVMIPRAE